MIIVTGGAGFIGSNLVRGLNGLGRTDIVVVDDLEKGEKLVNLADCDIEDLVDHRAFDEMQRRGDTLLDAAELVFHQGACTVTTEMDGRFLLADNYEFSKRLLDFCLTRGVRLIYASSAAVYGTGPRSREERECERPLNPYAFSKFLFDQHARRVLPRATTQIVGLRYFNVYGPREAHKGPMASTAFHFFHQLRSTGRVRLFEGSGGYGDGEQRRDFVYVRDAVDVNLWFMGYPDRSGIYNVGTGESRSFNDVARILIALNGGGEIEYIPFPVALRGRYQHFTEADVSALRACGYEAPFTALEDGLADYVRWLRSEAAGS